MKRQSVAILRLALAIGCAVLAAAHPAAAATHMSWGPPVPTGWGGLTGLSCPSARLCVATTDAGSVLSSTNPRGGPPTWKVITLNARVPGGAISCPSSTFCAAVATGGNVIVTTDPLHFTRAWKATHLEDQAIPTGISCPSSSLCVVIDGAQNVLTSTNPAANRPTWTLAHADDASSTECGHGVLAPDRCVFGFVSIDCPSVSLCVIADGEDNVVTSTNPTGGPSAWQGVHISVFPNESGQLDLQGVSCPSVSRCFVGTVTGLVSSRDPTGGAAAWPASATGVDLPQCPLTTLCVGDVRGAPKLPDLTVVSYDPTGGVSAWQTTIDRSGGPVSASCPSPALCVVLDQNGNVVLGTPTPSIAQIRRALRAPRPGRRFTFRAPSAGRLTVDWYLHGAARRRPLAHLSLAVSGPGARPVTVRLSPRGRRLLRTTTRPLALDAVLTFTAAQGPSVSISEPLTLAG